MNTSQDAAYRRCVGIMLLNPEGRVWVGKRNDIAGDHWQMPQGGIDEGEAPADAAMRELEEEIGTRDAAIIAESRQWLKYDLPRNLDSAGVERFWKGKYRGQTQRWFAMRFTGIEADIRPAQVEKPEFTEWKWVAMETLPDLIIPFKREVYLAVVDEFRGLRVPPG